MSEQTIPIGAVELMGTLMEHSLAESQHITNQLLEAYKEERDEERARVAAIRTEIKRLFAGPYQPSQAAIIAALYPTATVVNEFRDPEL